MEFTKFGKHLLAPEEEVIMWNLLLPSRLRRDTSLGEGGKREYRLRRGRAKLCSTLQPFRLTPLGNLSSFGTLPYTGRAKMRNLLPQSCHRRLRRMA